MNKQTHSLSRRSFFRSLGFSIGAFALSNFIGKGLLAKDTFSDADLPLLKESDADAKNLRYSADANRASVRQYTTEPGPFGLQKNCASCRFYSGVDKATGTCLVFEYNRVAATGWCMAWQRRSLKT